MEAQKTPNSQNNLEKEEQNWRNHTSWLLTIPQSYSSQNSVELAKTVVYCIAQANPLIIM